MEAKPKTQSPLRALIGAIRFGLAAKLARVDPTPNVLRAGLSGFVQHTNPAKAKRRAVIKQLGGIRQYKKARRAFKLANVREVSA